MDNPDILLQIASRMDNETLRSLSRTPIWNELSLLVSSQHYWFLRVEHLVPITLTEVSGDWKSTYYILLQGMVPRPLKNINLLSVEILLALGYNPAEFDNNMLEIAIRQRQIDVVRRLLQDDRVDPSWDKSVALRLAVDTDQEETVKLLLQNPRLECTIALFISVRNGSVPIVELLLRDSERSPSLEGIGRADPTASVHGGSILDSAIMRDSKIVRLLLRDKRMKSPIRRESMLLAVNEGNLEVIRALLEEGNISPEVREEALRESTELRYYHIADLLQA